MKNLRFNRVEKKGTHRYLKDFQGKRRFGNTEYVGYIKCKLAHNKTYSIVIPDQIYFEMGEQLYWIQPLYFSANMISKIDNLINCKLSVDISHGECLNVEFKGDGLVSKYDDGSCFYKCTIRGPKKLYRYRTGKATLNENKPFIWLHHHTSEPAMNGILNSNEFWSSNWNIQGTKKTTNIGYLYLTSLPKIIFRSDLAEIAMSSEGKLAFRVDQNPTSTPDLVLNVYRESTNNRTHTLSFWVDASLLATQPIYRHRLYNGHVYYEVVRPFIQRLGVNYGATIKIDGKVLKSAACKNLSYAVVGDATTISGLFAPLDEEDTEEILKIECIGGTDEITGFWMCNGNSNQYDNKNFEVADFQ